MKNTNDNSLFQVSCPSVMCTKNNLRKLDKRDSTSETIGSRWTSESHVLRYLTQDLRDTCDSVLDPPADQWSLIRNGLSGRLRYAKLHKGWAENQESDECTISGSNECKCVARVCSDPTATCRTGWRLWRGLRLRFRDFVKPGGIMNMESIWLTVASGFSV